MKTIMLCVVLVLALTTTVPAQSPGIYSRDGKFLGNMNSNPYDPNSVANPYGRYGSPYSPDSINNPYGRYGNPYSPESVHNPYGFGYPGSLRRDRRLR